MKVRELMTATPEACLPSESCAVAGEIMARRACGFLPVIDDQQARHVIGVVTDRDVLMHLVHVNQRPSDVPVEACMTTAVKCTSPSSDLEEAARTMETVAAHRLPVIEEGRLVGVLSLKDIALAARQQWAYAGPHVAERQMTEIVEAIAAAR